MRPREMIREFLNFLETADRKYEFAYADVGKEDSRVERKVRAGPSRNQP